MSLQHVASGFVFAVAAVVLDTVFSAESVESLLHFFISLSLRNVVRSEQVMPSVVSEEIAGKAPPVPVLKCDKLNLAGAFSLSSWMNLRLF